MKGIFLAFEFLAVLACAFAPPPPEMKAMLNECKTVIGISEDKPPHPDDEDPKAKCFHACILKKVGQMVDGKVSLEKGLEAAQKMIPDFDDSKKAAVTECVNKANAESDECEAAHALGKCLKESNLIPPPPPRQ